LEHKAYSYSGIVIVFLITFILINGGIEVEELLKTKSIAKVEKNYPSDWAWQQRVFPHFKADPRAHLDAIEEAKMLRQLKQNKNLAKSTSSAEWEFAGPENIGGRIADIEFNPVDPTIVYAAAATGGVFKSTDTGQTWFPVFDDQAVLPAGDIAIDPVNPNVVYVGTGEPNGSHNNLPGGGMFKSNNAGLSWTQIGLDSTSQIGRVIIDPTNTNRIFVAAVGGNFTPSQDRGVYRSTNAGSTWEKVLFVSDSAGAIDVVMDPSNPNLLLAAMWQRVRSPGYGQSETSFGPLSGIFKSTDGGDTWNKLGPANGLPSENSGVGRIGLAISQSSPNIIYAIYTDGGYYTGLYKSTNSGDNWTQKDLGFQISNGASSFSWYFGQIRINPSNPDIVYALDVAFMRSTDGGNNWPLQYGYGGPDELHVDHHALAFHPQNSSYLLSGNDGGINYSTDNGVTWSDPVHLPITQFYEIGIDVTNPERLYGGTQDNNTLRTRTGNVDDWEPILGGDGFYVNVDYVNPQYIYAEYQWGNLFKSTDGGFSFNDATNGINGSEPTNWSTPVVMDPVDPTILYYGTDRLYRTTNRADSWTPISPSLVLNSPITPRFGTLTTIAVAPTNTSVIYVGTDDSKVWVTTNLGNNWTDISTDLPFRWVTRVVVDPQDENIVYATFSGLKWGDAEPRVFRSTNMGNDWTNISGNLPDAPVNAFAVDLNNSDVLYLGNDVGVYYSTNTGANWEPLGTGMPIVSVYDMKIHPTENYLVAGTHGRSMYKIDLDAVTGVENSNAPIPEDFVLFNNYPNPFNPSTNIKFNVGSAGNVNLKIYDILGAEVTTLINSYLEKGEYTIGWYGKDNYGNEVVSGTYIYSLETEGKRLAKKMIMLK
jgi:photosystem II stability/assembly factor-like uncharacterized protein